jgi:DNA-directed RNA polymerase subunit RPC12/RpoP
LESEDINDNTGRVNCYRCTKCGRITKTIERVKGVTPFGIECPECGEDAMSTFYKDVAPDKPIEYEWVRPTLEECFEYCNRLKEVKLPDTIKTIGNSAFENCYNIDINSILNQGSITTLGVRAFYMVPYTNITLPSSVKKVGAYCFKADGKFTSWLDNKDMAKLNYSTCSKRVNVLNPDASLDTYAFDSVRNLTMVYTGEFKNRISFFELWDKDGPTDLMQMNQSTKRTIYIASVNEATRYQVKAFTDNKYKNNIYSKKIKSTSAAFKIDKPFSGDIYVRVRPYKVSGGTTTYGKWKTQRIYVD